MLIIPIKEGENIDRALKKFKKKFERTGAMRQLRTRQQFTKPSVVRRDEVLRARHIEKIRRNEEQ
jgi:small subunit ribosomal protein S21